MADQLPPLEHIMDTARWMAFYRAVESERTDALFRDPFARQLAGPHGEEIVRGLPLRRQSAWIAAVRTRAFDEMIIQAVEDGVDTVLNLGAGLDTRPYRLALPSALRWIEVDFPSILSYKQEKLQEEQPACLLERIPLDLTEHPARSELFARVGAQGKLVLVVTEGFLLYLPADHVAALARDLHAVPSFTRWLTALASPLMMRMLPKVISTHLARGAAQIQFAPEEGAAFFRPYGWRIAEFRASQEEARRLSREMPFGQLLQNISRLTQHRDESHTSPMGGFLLLKRA